MILSNRPENSASASPLYKLKQILLAAIFLLFTNAAMAQENDQKFIVDIAPQLSFTTGTLKKTNGFGYGGSLGFQFAAAEKLRLIARAAAIAYRGKSYTDISGYDGQYESLNLYLVTAGVKYFFTYGLFVAVQAGPVFANGGSGVTYAPVVGYELGDGPFYDVSIRYDSNVINGTTLNALTLSITYQF